MKFRPRFSLRTLLIAITLLCAFLGWLSSQLYWIAQRREALRTHRGSVYVWVSGLRPTIGSPIPPPRPPAPWPLRWLGEKGYDNIDVRRSAGQAEFNRVEKLFPEARVFWNEG